MSSVSWQKIHAGSEMSAMIMHAFRHDGKTVKYRNGYINPELSYLNATIVQHEGRRFDEISGKKEAERLKKRIEEIDKEIPPKRVRKDRVTSVAFCVSAMENLSPSEEKWFFEMSYRKIEELCGGPQNISAGQIHRDEVHDYIDCVTGEKRKSRAHLHVIGIPYVEGVGINGKQFMTKARMVSLNKAIDRECRETIHKPFMTGNKGLTGRSVEELQAESVRIVKKQAIEQAEQQHQQALDNLNKVSAETEAMEQKYQEILKQKESKVVELESLVDRYNQTAKKYNALVKVYNHLLDTAKRLKIAVDEKVRSLQQQIQR